MTVGFAMMESGVVMLDTPCLLRMLASPQSANTARGMYRYFFIAFRSNFSLATMTRLWVPYAPTMPRPMMVDGWMLVQTRNNGGNRYIIHRFPL